MYGSPHELPRTASRNTLSRCWLHCSLIWYVMEVYFPLKLSYLNEFTLIYNQIYQFALSYANLRQLISSDIKYLVTLAGCQVLSTKYLVPSIWRQILVLGTKYLLPNMWYQVLVTKYLVPSTRYQALSTKYLAPSTWYQVLGTKVLVPTPCYQVSVTKYLVPST